MRNPRHAVLFAMLLSFVVAAALPVRAAPLAGLHYLVGAWKCTYRGGGVRLAYDATYAYDLDGQTLRQTAFFPGGGDEELYAYDAQRHGWTSIVFDGQGSATILRGAGSGPNHIVYHSIYPDTSMAITFDHISATEYTLHATYRAGGKTINSVDTCLRGAH